jgi:hypothetical protein
MSFQAIKAAMANPVKSLRPEIKKHPESLRGTWISVRLKSAL